MTGFTYLIIELATKKLVEPSYGIADVIASNWPGVHMERDNCTYTSTKVEYISGTISEEFTIKMWCEKDYMSKLTILDYALTLDQAGDKLSELEAKYIATTKDRTKIKRTYTKLILRDLQNLNNEEAEQVTLRIVEVPMKQMDTFGTDMSRGTRSGILEILKQGNSTMTPAIAAALDEAERKEKAAQVGVLRDTEILSGSEVESEHEAPSNSDIQPGMEDGLV